MPGQKQTQSESEDAFAPSSAKYRLDSNNPLFSTTLVLPKNEGQTLSKLHARLLLDLVSLPGSGRKSRFSQASTLRIAVRYLLESYARSKKAQEHLVSTARRLLAVCAPTERINVFLLREDLPELLSVQVGLMSSLPESRRTLVIRCAIDLLDQAMSNPNTWMRVVRLAKESLPG